MGFWTVILPISPTVKLKITHKGLPKNDRIFKSDKIIQFYLIISSPSLTVWILK